MKRTFSFLLLLGLCATAATGQDAPRRSGFWLNIGAGYGSGDFNCDGCDTDREGGYAGQLALGGTLSETLLIGVESNGWAGSDPWGFDDAMMGTLAGVVYFYPSATGNLFVKGGAGLASWRLEASGQSEDDTGFGFLAGVGYDLPIARKFSITPVFTYQHGFMGDKAGLQGVTQNAYSIGATFTLH
jgi:hypothetical protein